MYQKDENTWLIEPRCVTVIGAGYAAGQRLTGVTKAPDVLRRTGLEEELTSLGWKVYDDGNLPSNPAASETTKCERPADVYYGVDDILNCEIIGAQNGEVFKHVKIGAAKGHFVVVIGGDHGIVSGSIAGMIAAHPDLCVVWVDAHGDCNTPESSPSKKYHGMPGAHLLGWFEKRVPGFEWMDTGGPHGGPIRLNEENHSLIGLRDLDEVERANITRSQIAAYTMQHIDHSGISTVVTNALSRIDPHSKRPIHLSLDVDACDPTVAPGTGTKARGGLTYREIHYLVETLSATGRLVSMDLVEINPEVEHGQKETVKLGIGLLKSALGKRIL